MKNLTTIAVAACLFLSGIAFAQTTSTPSTPTSPSEPATTQPDQQSPTKTDLTTSPASVPKTGNPSEDTLIRSQNKSGMKSNDGSMDKSKNKDMKKRKKNNSSQADTTGGSATNPRKPE